MEGHNLRIHHIERFWNSGLFADEGDSAFIKREAVKAGPKFRGKAFKFIQSIFFVKDFGISFQSMGGIKQTCTAAGALLGFNRMRGGVCAEEELRRA